MPSDHPAEWHHEKFVEFITYKQAVGEPSPHMTIAGHMSQGEPLAELYWRAGVYAAPYSVLTSEAIWREWPWPRAKADPDGLVAWVAKHWQGFHVRTERRMVRTPESMAKCLLSYRDWMLAGHYERLLFWQSMANDHEAYDAWYWSLRGKRAGEGVHNFGRYITIRVVEFMRRYAGAKAELYDIRSIGGESPVRCLSLLYPEWERQLLVDKDAKVADLLGEDLLERVQTHLPLVGHYVLAAMLCEYREAYEDHHQYPARTIDQELDYLNGPKGQYWAERGYHTEIWEARKAVIPHAALGEVTGKWSGLRHDLSRWLRDKGTNWTDTLYTYPEGTPR